MVLPVTSTRQSPWPVPQFCAVPASTVLTAVHVASAAPQTCEKPASPATSTRLNTLTILPPSVFLSPKLRVACWRIKSVAMPYRIYSAWLARMVLAFQPARLTPQARRLGSNDH